MSEVTLDAARRVIAAAEKKATEIGQPMNIAVVDAGGDLVMHVRMDGAWRGSVDIAINKAFTAAGHRKPTHVYKNAVPGEEAFGIMTQHQGRFTIFVGGWPIEVDGEVVGAVSASGGNGEQDIACCKAGIDALMASLGKTADHSKWER